MPTDGWVQVKVLVRVDMVERQAGLCKCRELRVDLGGQLPAGGRPQEDRNAGPDHVFTKAAVRIDQVGNLLCRQHGTAIDQHHMQAHPQ